MSKPVNPTPEQYELRVLSDKETLGTYGHHNMIEFNKVKPLEGLDEELRPKVERTRLFIMSFDEAHRFCDSVRDLIAVHQRGFEEPLC